MFLDADCMALRNVDHLFDLPGDIIVQREAQYPIQSNQFSGYLKSEEYNQLTCDGINSGTFIVSGDKFKSVIQHWKEIDESIPARHGNCRDQSSWNRMILDTDLIVNEFPSNEVAFPLHLTPKYQDYIEAAVVHCLGVNLEHKVRFMFGLYSNIFLCDPRASMLHIWES